MLTRLRQICVDDTTTSVLATAGGALVLGDGSEPFAPGDGLEASMPPDASVGAGQSLEPFCVWPQFEARAASLLAFA